MINYFHAIQTALFYKKNAFEMFKPNLNLFIHLQGSCGENNKNRGVQAMAWKTNWVNMRKI